MKLLTSVCASCTESRSFFATCSIVHAVCVSRQKWYSPFAAFRRKEARSHLRNAHAIDQPEAHDLRSVALFFGNFAHLLVHDLRRKPRVHVSMPIKQPQKRRVTAHVSEHAHLDLAVVRRQQDASGPRAAECAAH